MPIDQDAGFMALAIEEAAKGLGRTAENPSVGCVLVKDGKQLAKSHTQDGGRPHAEAHALSLISAEQAKGSTAYVTLEPCSHTGKSPPCASALITAGVARVVVACSDPDPRVSGRGFAMLREAGIEVVERVSTDQASVGLQGFFKRLSQGQPLVTLKMATSLDGRIALSNGQSQWITGPEARQHGHILRGQSDAILTGIGSVLADDSSLTCRHGPNQDCSPIRVLLDRHARAPVEAKIFSDQDLAPTLWSCSPKPAAIPKGVQWLPLTSEVELLQKLGSMGISNLMLEAGQGIATSFLKAGLIDRLAWFTAPKILGGDGLPALGDLGFDAMSQIQSWRILERQNLDQDSFQLLAKV